MDKGKIEAMVTKFLEKFGIIMLKKHRKFCRRGLTHLDATPIFKKSSGSFWDTLYTYVMKLKNYQNIMVCIRSYLKTKVGSI